MDDFTLNLKSRPKPTAPKHVVLVVPGASLEQLQTGEAAALAHLEQNGLTPWDVAKVFGALETWDDDGITEDSELPELPTKPGEVWTAACGIAFQVACAGLPGGIPGEAKVVLYDSWESWPGHGRPSPAAPARGHAPGHR